LGQYLFVHVTKKASEIDDKLKDDWEAINYKLVSLLWNYIEAKLTAHFHSLKTCYEIWNMAKNIYANDV